MAMDPIGAETIAKAVGELSKVLPQTLERVSALVKTVSDNQVRIKLEVMSQNLAIYRSKLEIARLLLESEHELTNELLRDLMTMQNRLVEMNYELAEVVGSTTRERTREKLVDGLVDFVKKHPEVLALPFGGPPMAGGVWLTKKLLALRGGGNEPEPE
jgi:hypothetical protein